MSRTKIISLCLLAVILIGVSFGGGWLLGNGGMPEETSDGLDMVVKVWQVIHEDYVDRDSLDDEALAQGAVRGILEALDDPHSTYLDAGTYELMTNDRIQGKYEGIGAYVGQREEDIIIIAPITGSPAELAGIRPGDKVIEIDGTSTEGMSVDEAVLIIRGPQGTPVNLLVLHEDETEPEMIEIVRAEIEVPSVSFEMEEEIAYIHISNFSQNTDDELSTVMQQISWNGAEGIVLDLRSNGGGLLTSVIDIAGYFLPGGEVAVHLVDKNGQRVTDYVKQKDAATELPMVVLVDSYTASAGEIMTGYLQDHERATIAGNVTYGKGSVNILLPLQDGGGLYITTGRWLTPDGNIIEGVGLTPDIELDLENVDAIEWAIEYLRGE